MIAMRRAAFALLLTALSCGLTGRAWALSCSVSTTPVAFGVYSPTNSSTATTTAVVTITCQSLVAIGVSYTISLSGGSSGTAAARALLNGTNPMSYQLYTNATYSTVWGDGTGGSQTVSDGYAISLVAPVVKLYTVYASAPARQNLVAGSYNDTVSVMITY